jgi:general secretion pathway protein G
MMRRRGLARLLGWLLMVAVLTAATVLVLSAVVVPRVLLRRGDARRAATVVQVRLLMSELEKYQIDNSGRVPTTDQGLEALASRPTVEPKPKRWRGPYIDQVPKDGWGNDFQYVAMDDGRRYHLWSLGADNKEHGEGPAADIKSWDRSSWVEE